MPRKPRKPAPRRAGATPRRPAAPVRLHPRDGGPPITVGLGERLREEAMYWSYVTRMRERWADETPGDEERLAGLATADELRRVAEAGLVEVEVPWTQEEEGWEARIFPWEYLLARLTRPHRAGRLTVVRHLAVAPRPAAARVRLDRVAVVESAPGELADLYDVASEGDLMLAALGQAAGGRGGGPLRLRDPGPEALGRALSAFGPTLVHLAGVDTHQASDLLGRRFPAEAREYDGLAMQGPGGEPVPVAAAELARSVGACRPDLVVHNFYDSASRTAALTVAEGAGHAVGFHDTVDDALAEMFCSGLYRELRRRDGDVLGAFEAALSAAKDAPDRLRGAGVVLWSARSLLAGRARPARPTRARRAPAAPAPARERVRVKCEPLRAFNYALLHNGRSLFKAFTLYRLDDDGPVADVEVEVELWAGEARFAYRATVALPPSTRALDLRDRVVVPLTAEAIRTQGEAIQSSLFVSVRCQGETLLRETHRLLLEPVDGWTDTPRDREWLASFVLPRDPAVAGVVDAAQRYLMAIADDPAAGFDGYQSVEPDEALPPEVRCAAVDAQVRAIWSALLHDHQLSYVNPPPSYAQAVQRLRTPSDVLRGRRGTCIDLALLLAACLEYVDVYPVIFLLQGHAFPGYWRSEAYHDEFVRLLGVPLAGEAGGEAGRRGGPGQVHAELRERLRQGHLVALETVWLTSHQGFEAARQEGQRNLRHAAEFEALLDVVGERARGVTPLPLLWRPT